MQHTINYGSRKWDVEISRSSRKTLQVEVHPDLSVKIIAPENAAMHEIEQRIIKKARWILKQQAYFEQFLPRTPQREYVSGETHRYLGRRYLLKIRKTADKEGVKLKGGELLVFVRDINDKQSVIHTLTAWYYRHAYDKFAATIQRCMQSFKLYHLKTPSWEIKRMRKRWGSCTPKEKILLNPELIKTPSRCIEYVVVHELCHLIHPNHNKDFYQLQEKIMPDWKKWKNKLEIVSS